MDIARPDLARRKMRQRVLLAVAAVLVVSVVGYFVSRLEPAAPTVERAAIWMDTVKRGPMLRQVRGLGSLVPEEILMIPALVEGRVAQIVNLPGVVLRPDSVVVVLTNPELEVQAKQAEWALREAESQLDHLRVQLESERLDKEASLARVQSEYMQAKLKGERDDRLLAEGLAVELDVQLARATRDELARRFELEQRRVEIGKDAIAAQIAAKQVQIEQLKSAVELAKERVAQLTVRAGTHGVLQAVSVQPGEQVAMGTPLARVARPERLKAQIRISETQAKDIVIGQTALVDTRNGTVEGLVARIDPAVVEGTVTVDIRLTGPLPAGARPDLSVDGVVELERLDDVVFVGRPAFGQPDSTVGLFRLDADGTHAVRVPVQLGKSSVSTVEVVQGLQPGDQVILSDMSQWDSHDRVRIR